MNIKKIAVSVIALSLVFFGNTNGQNSKKQTAAGCAAPSNFSILNINDVSARINTGPDMFWDHLTQPHYEVPKGNGTHAVFAAMLWLGGTDQNGQVKVAAGRLRQVGIDYFMGPLSTKTATTNNEMCEEYDRFFEVKKAEVETFVNYHKLKKADPTLAESTYPNYQIPESILNWPAHGKNYEPYNHDYYLAPFFDANADGVYNPNDGDYPNYDLSNNQNCQNTQNMVLMGDQTLWQIFNDAGNQHTETGGIPIGMEIRMQAFAYNQSPLNHSTFYNYQLINRSSHTLNNFYAGFFFDADLGNSQDDYVACDVQRGFGYVYNGDNNDEDNGGATGYGVLPPAVGLDFFQGLQQDADGIDNTISTNSIDWNNGNIPYPGLGSGFNDLVVDNERVGMSKFLYYTGNSSPTGDPRTAIEYYNYMQAVWRDGTPMQYGGTGYPGGSATGIRAHYMYPGDSDPYWYNTRGINPNMVWSEESSGNSPFDRRFSCSTGPVTMQPGAVNSFTMGVVWARAKNGNNFSSVSALRQVNDITQNLFDNCFEVVETPDAPIIEIAELDRKLILSLVNPSTSNNYLDNFIGYDKTIIVPDSIMIDGKYAPLSSEEKQNYNAYKLQGYLVYQVKNRSVTLNDLENPNLAKLIFQSDKKDNISTIVNYEFNPEINSYETKVMVKGANKGLQKSFEVYTDAFTGDSLINHQSYYFLAVAYAYNNFKPVEPNNIEPTHQLKPFIKSTNLINETGLPHTGMPHQIFNRRGGMILQSNFGTSIKVQKLEGAGSGGVFLQVNEKTREKMVQKNKLQPFTYEAGGAPVYVKVVDPLQVKPGNYFLQMVDTAGKASLNNVYFKLYGDSLTDTLLLYGENIYNNEFTISQLGISITINQAVLPGSPLSENNGVVGAQIEFKNKLKWLTGVEDADGLTPQNWILAGTKCEGNQPNTAIDESDYNDWDWYYNNGINKLRNIDPDEHYEKLLNGTWTAFRLAADHPYGPIPYLTDKKPNSAARSNIFRATDWVAQPDKNHLQYLENVDIVITPNKDYWTRVPVIEMADTNSEGDVLRGRLRAKPSLNKNGKPYAGENTDVTDPDAANYISPIGMSWFPGYAVNIETGERLNMAFGESSYLKGENGNDMIWNPTSNVFEGPFNDVRFGGLHYIYVFRNNRAEENQYTFTTTYNDPKNLMPAYDNGKFLVEQLIKNSSQSLSNVYRAGMWVGLPILANGFEFKTMANGLVPSEAIIKLRVATPLQPYASGNYLSTHNNVEIGEKYFVQAGPIEHDGKTYVKNDCFVASSTTIKHLNSDSINVVTKTQNGGRPFYKFSLVGVEPLINQQSIEDLVLQNIQVVPNPFRFMDDYLFGNSYNGNVRITNLPEECTINIYAINGTLVKQFKKANSQTFIEWDLKNEYGSRISTGVYLFYITTPSGGERLIKWAAIVEY